VNRIMLNPGWRARAVAALAGALVLVGHAAAQDPDMATRTITVAKDKSAAFHLDQPVGEIVVAQPDMVQLVATTDHGFYIRGKAVGTTNLLIYDRAHHLTQVVDVQVGRDLTSLQSDLVAALPREHIIAANFAGGVLLTGEASTSATAARAAEIAEHYAPKEVTSQITLKAAQQIMVEVRVLEINRTALKDMGFNLTATNSSGLNIATGTGLITGAAPAGAFTIGGKIGGTTVDLTLQALETKGLLRTLARPNLTAMSGEEASFLAGGEFPYPVPAGLGQVTIEFRQYGVKLKVTPTIQASGEIKLKVAPEVSQLDQAHSIQIDGFLLPSIDISNASTTVELKDGQSFAIAGLFQQSYNNSINQVPGLGNLPVLGTLFRSASYQRQETELAILVTPRLMTPVDHIESLPNPFADAREPSAIDLILAGLTEKPGPTTSHPATP
jgi:pilus assembly protein CpaC